MMNPPEGVRRLALIMAFCGAIAGALYSKETLFSEVEEWKWGFRYVQQQRAKYPGSKVLEEKDGYRTIVDARGIPHHTYPWKWDNPPQWYDYLPSLIPVILGIYLGWGAAHPIAWVSAWIEGFAIERKRG